MNCSFPSKASRCLVYEENREAGENPARSRHCEESRSECQFDIRSRLTLKSGDLPELLCSLWNTSRKGVEASGSSNELR